MARQRSAKPSTAVRIRSRPLFFLDQFLPLSDFPFYTKKQEQANIISHLLGIVFFVPAGFVLLQKGNQLVQTNSIELPHLLLAGLLFSVITALMTYVSSVHYHSSSIQHKIAYRKWDHISIFWSIAGFYVPFIILQYELSGKKLFLLFIMIGLAIAGSVFKLFFLQVNKLVYTAIYLLMGWMVVFFGKDFFANIPTTTIVLLITGGIAYSIGVYFYLQKKLYYSHAIWHCFVLLGGVLHYFSIYSFLTSLNAS